MSWKSVNVSSTENVMTTAMIGDSIGRVTNRNRCQGPAPSSVAASYSEGEMVCKPASKVMATNGMPRQTFAAITDHRAFQGLPRKSMYWWMSPSLISDQEMIENCGS